MLTIALGVLLIIAAINSYNHARYTWSSGHSTIWVGLEFVLGSIVLVAGVLMTTTVVHAQSDGQVDFSSAANELRAYLVDVAMIIAFAFLAWLTKKLREKFGLDLEVQLRALEEKHRGTLHSAVDTWTKAAMVKFPGLKFEVGSPALEFVLDGVAKSAPEAIKALGATQGWIANKAAGIAGVDHPSKVAP